MRKALLHFYSMCKNWVKTMALRLLHRTRHETPKEPEPAPGVLTDLDRKLGAEIQKRQARGKAINTRQGGPNMPKYQPCPKRHGMKKREDKAVVGGIPGALYYCNQCKDSFFVRAK